MFDCVLKKSDKYIRLEVDGVYYIGIIDGTEES